MHFQHICEMLHGLRSN